MDIIGLLVVLVLLCLLFWAVQALTSAFGLPAPIVAVIRVIMVVIAVLWILQATGLWSGSLRLR